MGFMPDFGKIAETATKIDKGLDRIDGRLTEIVEALQINNGLQAAIVTNMISEHSLSASPEQRERIEAIFAVAFGERAKLPFSPTGINGDDDGTEVPAG